MGKDVKLTEMSEAMAEPYLMLDKAYVIDPPPFILKYLDELVIKQIFNVKYRTLARVAELKSEILKEEAKMFIETSKIMEQNIK